MGIIEPKMSVIVPVYNTAAYLEEALESLRVQTLEDAEFILVDDCSTDESPAIMAAYVQKDARFIPVTLSRNSERHMARKAGVEAARGRYLLFMDSDDALAGCDALAALYDDMQAQDADVLQFGMKIEGEPDTHQATIAWFREHGRPCLQRIEGSARELLDMVFVGRRWIHNLWGKVFRAQIVKKAFAAAADERLSNAEDLYEYFLITYFSRSYAGIDGRDYYVYHYGRGAAGQKNVSLAYFSGLCSRHKVIGILRAFLEERKEAAAYEDMLQIMDQRFLRSTILTWKNRISRTESEAAFSLMCNAWTCEKVALQMEEFFGKAKKESGAGESAFRPGEAGENKGRNLFGRMKDALYDFAAVRHEGIHREYAFFKRKKEFAADRTMRWRTLIRLNVHYRILGKKTYCFMHQDWAQAYAPQYRAARMQEAHPYRGALPGGHVIVSMTSYPARINTILPAVYSLIDQDRRPERILLWLSEDQFPGRENDLPAELVQVARRCPFFEIRWVQGDLKPHKKYFYVMQEYPDMPVITVDDDAVYQKDMVRVLMKSYRRHPRCVSAMWALEIGFDPDGNPAPFLTWARECDHMKGIPSHRLLPIGVSGVLYPPHAIPECAFDAQAIRRCAEVTDDLWLKVFASHQGYAAVVPEEKFKKQTIKGTQHCALYYTNDFDGNNDAALEKILRHYDEHVGSREALLRLWNAPGEQGR